MRNKEKNKEKELIYDNYLLNTIIKDFKYDPYIVIHNLNQYIDRYPLDVLAYTYYAQVLIDINDLESAKVVLNYIDENFRAEKDERVLFNKFRILCLSEQNEESKKFYDEHKYELLNIDTQADNFELIYKTKIGESMSRKYHNRYLHNQLIQYREDDFINHIQKHLADFNENSDNPNPAVFNADFPLEIVLDEIKKLIPNNKKTNLGFYSNLYVFKYDNAGRINYKPVDYFRVIIIHGTKNIITMYPLEHGENLPYIDLNYLNPIYQKPKVRTMSRVDRFYNKYGRI